MPVVPRTRNDRFTVDELAWEIAQLQTDASTAPWKEGNRDDDMRRTVVSAMNKHGWTSQDGGPKSVRPGALPHILKMLERREITVQSTLNNMPPVEFAQVVASPAYWYMTEADADKVRAAVLGTYAGAPIAASRPDGALTPAQSDKHTDNDTSIIEILRDAARRLLWAVPELGRKWETEPYARAFITDELREIWYRCAQKRDEQEIYTACENVVCEIWRNAPKMEGKPNTYDADIPPKLPLAAQPGEPSIRTAASETVRLAAAPPVQQGAALSMPGSFGRERIKIRLTDAARNRCCNVDELLMQAQQEIFNVYAVLKPFSADGRDYAGRAISGAPTIRTGDISPSYTTLLSGEVEHLRCHGNLIIKVWREEGREEGISIPQLGSEPVLFFLTSPQTIGIDDIWLYADNLSVQKITQADDVPAGLPLATEAATNETLSAALTEHFDRPARPPNILPERLQGWVRRVFTPAPVGPGYWIDLTPDERREAAAAWDDKNTAEAQREDKYWWDLELSINELKRKIADWESMHHQGIPSEAALKEKTLSTLRDDLAELERKWEVPFSAPMEPPAEPLPVSPSQRAAEGITKNQILAAFDALVTTNLSKAMSDGAKWAVRARVSKGARGRDLSVWCPLLMAVELCERRLATKAAINRAFFTYPFLADWRERWHEHSEAI